jgi:hypothetical protein
MAGGAGFGLSVDLMGSSASQRAVAAHMAVHPEEACHADFCFPAIAVGGPSAAEAPLDPLQGGPNSTAAAPSAQGSGER